MALVEMFNCSARKRDQRRIRLSFNRGCAQFDLNCAAVLAHDTIAHGIRNDVNPQNLPFGPSYQRRGETRSTDFGAACDDMHP